MSSIASRALTTSKTDCRALPRGIVIANGFAARDPREASTPAPGRCCALQVGHSAHDLTDVVIVSVALLPVRG